MVLQETGAVRALEELSAFRARDGCAGDVFTGGLVDSSCFETHPSFGIVSLGKQNYTYVWLCIYIYIYIYIYV